MAVYGMLLCISQPNLMPLYEILKELIVAVA